MDAVKRRRRCGSPPCCGRQGSSEARQTVTEIVSFFVRVCVCTGRIYRISMMMVTQIECKLSVGEDHILMALTNSAYARPGGRSHG